MSYRHKYRFYKENKEIERKDFDEGLFQRLLLKLWFPFFFKSFFQRIKKTSFIWIFTDVEDALVENNLCFKSNNLFGIGYELPQ